MQSGHPRRAALLQFLRAELQREALPATAQESTKRAGLRAVRQPGPLYSRAEAALLDRADRVAAKSRARFLALSSLLAVRRRRDSRAPGESTDACRLSFPRFGAHDPLGNVDPASSCHSAIHPQAAPGARKGAKAVKDRDPRRAKDREVSVPTSPFRIEDIDLWS